MRKFAFLLLLFSILFADANVTSEGGNVTQIFFNTTLLSENWDGMYGQVVLGVGSTVTYTVVGDNIIRIDLSGSSPPAGCIVRYINIVAINRTLASPLPPLTPGNLTQLDELINSSENASYAFTFTDSYSLSFANVTNVSSLYTRSYDGLNHFEMGYMNDANKDLVFVAKYNADKIDWNNTLSDYQIMLPKGSANMDYTLAVDTVYTCPPGGGGGRSHELYIPPIPSQSSKIGETKNVLIFVENIGDYTETNVRLSVVCPASFSCGNANLGTIHTNAEKNATIAIAGNEIGTFILKAEARSDDAYTYREFYFTVEPECIRNEDCASEEYCENGKCVEKKEINETCKNDYECKTGLCEGMKCVECKKDEECAWNEKCANGFCVLIVCECGEVKNHACVPYECCTHEDCMEGEVCINHVCTENKANVEVVGKNMTEGAYVDVFVTDLLGNPIEGARVYTEDMFAYTDGSGRAKIRIPYSGIIYVDALGKRIGKYLDITRLAYIKIKSSAYVMEEIHGSVRDSKNKGIGIVEILYDDNKTAWSDGNSEFKIQFGTPGLKEVRGKKAAYLIKSATIDVVSPAQVCYFPYLLNLIGLRDNEIFALWVAAVLLAVFNFFAYRKRTLSKFVRAFLYSFAPILLSLPNTWPLSICFMMNIVCLQVLYEVALIIKKKQQGKRRNKE
ncbi:MAG: hypothetical protein QXL47_03525 [Candidatus Anstonellales archaeon]